MGRNRRGSPGSPSLSSALSLWLLDQLSTGRLRLLFSSALLLQSPHGLSVASSREASWPAPPSTPRSWPFPIPSFLPPVPSLPPSHLSHHQALGYRAEPARSDTSGADTSWFGLLQEPNPEIRVWVRVTSQEVMAGDKESKRRGEMGREGATGQVPLWELKPTGPFWEQVREAEALGGFTHHLWSTWRCSLKGTGLRFLPLWPVEPQQGGVPGQSCRGDRGVPHSRESGALGGTPTAPVPVPWGCRH